jgi:formylglycine-generating enzyme required for sulfatase activity
MSAPVITVELQPQADGRIEVQTKTSLAGQSQAVVSPPFRETIQRQAVALALEAVSFNPSFWQKIPLVFQALKDLGLANDSGFTDLREGIGRALFEAYFPPGGLREALRINLNAAPSKAPARIELTFRAEDAEMGAYPWELLYDESRGFLFANSGATLIRYIAYEKRIPRLPTSDRVNLLLVTSRPISQPTDPIQLPLLVDAEAKAIEDGLAEPLTKGVIDFESLPPASPSKSTWELLSDYLITHTAALAPHILHFDGHGGFGRRCASAPAGCGLLNPASDTVCRGCGRPLDGPAQGYLAFEARNQRPHWVSAAELSNLLVNTDVRLAVLTACKSAVVAGRSVFSGMGTALIQAGVPAVVAMQFSVTVDAAKSFTRSFYLALAQYAPLTQAMSQVRAALFVDETAWYRPVLYLRTDDSNPDGKLFARKRKTRKPGSDDPPGQDPGVIYPPPPLPGAETGKETAADSAVISSPIRLELVRVPAGPFLMGSDPKRDPRARENEQPQRSVVLPELYIGKYPVTNAQFAVYVKAKGAGVPKHWQGGSIPDGKKEHPVVNVSWGDALAFCRWLSDATGQAFRLPTEAEWEKAARGMGDRIYPWGGTDPEKDKTLCNCDRWVDDTTPVGKYPNGASSCRAMDLAGNVWEWTSSLYAGYPYDAEDGREIPSWAGLRVLRGGSFDFNPSYVRCSCRHWEAPNSMGDCIGFRVVAPVAGAPVILAPPSKPRP